VTFHNQKWRPGCKEAKRQADPLISSLLVLLKTFGYSASVRFIQKHFAVAVLGGLLSLLSGCASQNPRLVLDTIGPVSGGRANFLALSKGFLQVHSATYSVNSGGIIYLPHTPYSVYSPEGKRLWGVINHVGEDDNRPMTIEIPPGIYVVYAQSDRFGQVKAPVLIVANKTTAVYLEGRGMPNPGEVSKADLVLLPDGRIAGRRAEDTTPPAKKP